MIHSDLVRLDAVWAAVRDRLAADAPLADMLRGTAANDGARRRVYLQDDDYADPDGKDGTPWARIVLVPPQTFYDLEQPTGTARKGGVLVRSEVANFQAAGYHPLAAHAAIQARVARLLSRWRPPDTPHARAVLPLYIYQPFQSFQSWDATRSLWLASADYRGEWMNGAGEA